MKKYYIEYTQDFANTYRLYWADERNADSVTSNMERISRKEAIYMAKEEADRRIYDQAMSGYADDAIYPVDFDENTLYDYEFPRIMGEIVAPSDSEPRIWEYVTEAKRSEWEAALAEYKKLEADHDHC